MKKLVFGLNCSGGAQTKDKKWLRQISCAKTISHRVVCVL